MESNLEEAFLARILGSQPRRDSAYDKRPLCGFRPTTDNAGVIAFDLRELMRQETWFNIFGHGYEVPDDGFGSHGVRFNPEPGKTSRAEVTRENIAKRLGWWNI